MGSRFGVEMKYNQCLTVLVLCSIVNYSVTVNPAIISKTNTTSKNVTVSPVTEPSVFASSTTTKRPLQGLRLPCSCVEGQCGCCTGAVLDRFRQKICMNFTYEPDDFAFTASMSMNGKVLYKNTVSGKNPPPMCASIPRLNFIRLCVEFSNLYFASRNMHVCIDMEANWDQVTLVEWSFDCIRMGISGFAVVPPEEGGGLPPSVIDQEEQTDEDYDDSARAMIIPRTVPQKTVAGPNLVIFDDSLAKVLERKTINKTAIEVKDYSNGYYVIAYNNK